MSELQEIEVIKNRLLEQRVRVTSLIEKEQNLILSCERKLENLSESHFTADRSGAIRFLLGLVGIKDEIQLRQEIARSETIISQWNSRLVEISSIFSETLIAVKGHQLIVDTIATIRDSYRTIRIDLGKARREIQLKLKDSQNMEENQAIVENYLENIEKLKKIGPNSLDSASKNGQLIAQLFRDIKVKPDQLSLAQSFSSIIEIKKSEPQIEAIELKGENETKNDK